MALAVIAATLAGGEVGGAGGPLLGGYAAAGDSLRGAIEGLGAALPVAFADGPEGLRLVDEGVDPVAIDPAALGAFARGAKAGARLVLDRQAAGTLNAALTIG